MIDDLDLPLKEHQVLFHKEDRLIVDALAQAGVTVSSIEELVNDRRGYATAIPTLIEMLDRVKYLPIKDSVVRALGDATAKGKADEALLKEFYEALSLNSRGASDYRWVIANTLGIISSKRLTEPLLHLLEISPAENSKGMLALAAAKTKDERFIPILIGMLDRGECPGHVSSALGKLKAKEAIGRLRKLAKCKVQTSWVRREARKALERIGAELEEEPIVN